MENSTFCGIYLFYFLSLLLLTEYPRCCSGSWMWLGITTAGLPEKMGCGNLPLSDKQKEICKKKPYLLPSIKDGARLGIAECQTQFKHERWNCSTTKDFSVFGYELTSGTKETAFIYAVMAAGLVHAVTRSCSAGNMTECSCDMGLQGTGSPSEGWHWGGCSDHIQYGTWFSRRFLDHSLEQQQQQHALPGVRPRPGVRTANGAAAGGVTAPGAATSSSAPGARTANGAAAGAGGAASSSTAPHRAGGAGHGHGHGHGPARLLGGSGGTVAAGRGVRGTANGAAGGATAPGRGARGTGPGVGGKGTGAGAGAGVGAGGGLGGAGGTRAGSGRNGANASVVSSSSSGSSAGSSSGAGPSSGSAAAMEAIIAMHQHNSEAGRQAVAKTMSTDCRCHGVSGSCAVKTCWRTMAPFERVGRYLKERYETSVQVLERTVPASGGGGGGPGAAGGGPGTATSAGATGARGTLADGGPGGPGSTTAGGERRIPAPPPPPPARKVRRREKGRRRVPVGREELVFLHKSPNYCLEDRRLGVAGTRGRRCNRTSNGADGCGLLCCGRGYNTHVVRHVERCDCKFVWCCYVRCRRCESMNDMHTCK